MDIFINFDNMNIRILSRLKVSEILDFRTP